MKLAQINFPKTDNNGKELFDVHALLIDALTHAYGGLTYHSATGLWINADGKHFAEEVIVYTIAIPDAHFASQQLREIAIHFGEKAEQEAVFIVIAGRPEIISLVGEDLPTEGIKP